MPETDLEKIMNNLMSIPKEEIEIPATPVSVYLQEAEDLVTWATDDKDKLIAKGLDWSIIEEIPVRAGALRIAQSGWAKTKKEKNRAVKELGERLPVIKEFYRTMIDSFRYAYRKDKSKLSIITRITRMRTQPGLVQALNNLSVYGRSNTGPLESINFDLKLLDKSGQLSKELAKLIARAKAKAVRTDSFNLRNRAYTYLKKAVDEIRSCGKFVFIGDEERQKGYRSEYMYKKNRKRAENKKKNVNPADQNEAPVPANDK